MGETIPSLYEDDWEREQMECHGQGRMGETNVERAAREYLNALDRYRLDCEDEDIPLREYDYDRFRELCAPVDAAESRLRMAIEADPTEGEAVITGAFNPNAMPYAIVSNGVRYVPADALLDALLAERGYEKRWAIEDAMDDGYDCWPEDEASAKGYADPYPTLRAVEIYVPRQKGEGE